MMSKNKITYEQTSSLRQHMPCTYNLHPLYHISYHINSHPLFHRWHFCVCFYSTLNTVLRNEKYVWFANSTTCHDKHQIPEGYYWLKICNHNVLFKIFTVYDFSSSDIGCCNFVFKLKGVFWNENSDLKCLQLLPRFCIIHTIKPYMSVILF